MAAPHHAGVSTLRTKSMARSLSVAVAALIGMAAPLTAGSIASPGPSPACVADLERLVQPILNLRCVQCHKSVSGDGGLSLQAAGTAERIILAPSSGSPLNLIQPGRPDESYLYLKITGRQAEGNGAGARMPLIGSRLSDETIETIRAWIDGCTVVPADD